MSWLASASPDSVAIRGARNLTYAELLARSSGLAELLRARGVKPGDVVGVWLAEPVAGIVAALASWLAGAAFVPIDESTPPARAQFILTDCGARACITDLERAPSVQSRVAIVLSSDALDQPSGSVSLTPTSSEDVAYIIYTSGSTGQPKGVAIRHRNLENFVSGRTRLYGPAPRLLPVHSLAFDPMVGGMAWTLATGGTLIAVDAQVRRDPDALRALILSHGATHLSAVPALYAAILRDATRAQLASLRACLIGGEALPASLATSHYAKAPLAILFNEYGPTEATITSTVYAVPRNGASDPMPIGKPFPNARCYVLDADLKPVGAGESGELYVGGAGVGVGYVGRPELTAARFVADPFAQDPAAKMYRSGDRARWLADGNLAFEGRADFQVKVRGHRVELTEIQRELEACDGVREAVVVALPRANEVQLAAYYTTVDGGERADLAQVLQRRLPDYMLPAFFEHLPALPVNAAGKVDRLALAAPRKPAATPNVESAAWSSAERAVAGIWREVLELESVDRATHFFEAGGNSLLVMMVVSRIREVLGLRVPVQALFDAPQLSEFAATLASCAREQPGAAANVCPDASEPVPIAPLQATFWYLAQLEPESTAYVVRAQFRVRGALELERFSRALDAVVMRNEVLRTRIGVVRGSPMQIVVPDAGVKLEHRDLRAAPHPDDAARSEAQEFVRRRFDISSAPLLRCQLLQIADAEYLLTFAAHHIVFDGWSVGLLLHQVFERYEALQVAPRAPNPDSNSAPQYRGYAWRAAERLQGPRRGELLDYWRDKLAGVAHPVTLPSESPNLASTQQRTGAVVRRQLSPELTQRLRAKCLEFNTTHFALHLAVFKLIVARWTGVHDVTVGTPVALRNETSMESLIGCFVNSVVLRTSVPPLTATFRELLTSVRSTTLDALAHAELPFDMLVTELNPRRESRQENSFFRLFFNDIDRRRELPACGSLALEPITDEAPLSKFDLTFYIHQWDRHDELELVYDPRLFDAHLISQLASQFEHLLEQVVVDASLPLGRYSLRTPRDVALPDPRVALDPSRGSKRIQDAFYAQARVTPERLAILSDEEQLTYGELAERVNGLASALLAAGTQVGDRLAVYAARSVDLIISVLAALETGCSFTVVDAGLPESWVCPLVQQLRPRVWVSATDAPLALELERIVAAIPVRVDANATRSRSTVRMPSAGTPDSEAYVIFTSGTTGRPKGVVGRHRPVVHFIDWYTHAFCLNSSDRFSMLSGLGHDPLMRDVFAPLSLGAMLCIPALAIRKDPSALSRWMRERSISVAHITPSLGTLLGAGTSRTEPLSALRLIMFGGERLHSRDVERAGVYAPRARLVNCYGTTETPQVVGHCEVTTLPDHAAPPIGRGIADTQMLVVNPLGEPAGVAELGTIQVRTPYLLAGYLAADGGVTPAAASDVYPTGDLGRYDHEGRVQFAGRADRQMKVRGFRVELAAVEETLEGLSSVAHAHAVTREDPDGSIRLVAYIVTKDPNARSAATMRGAFERCSFGAMCPDSFVFVDSLPLTANGKVDARLLPTVSIHDAPQATAFREPHTATELVTAQVWRELLEVSRVGLDDDFFELGGHSLLAVRMLGVLGDRLGRPVPMSLLVKCSKLGGFAAEIDDSDPFVGEKRVVQLSASPTGQRFWLIHPVGGYVVFARRFASLIERDLSVYGIQAKGLDGHDVPVASIAEMAREYLALIRAQQPIGPYYIGGFSLGGTIAYEMAQQLVARGEEPGMVAMFDTFAPGFPYNKPLLPWLREKLADARQRGFKSSMRRYSQRFHDQEAADALKKFGPELQDVIRANRYASRTYKIKPYRGVVTMFRAADVPYLPGRDVSDLSNGWSKHAHVDVEVIDATHNSLFGEPAVRCLAQRFLERFHRAVSGPSGREKSDLFERTRRWMSSHYDDVFAGGRPM